MREKILKIWRKRVTMMMITRVAMTAVDKNEYPKEVNEEEERIEDKEHGRE